MNFEDTNEDFEEEFGNELNTLEQSKKEAKNEGLPLYMDSMYCKNFIKKHKSCDKCEYNFACTSVLQKTIKKSTSIIKKIFLERSSEMFEDEVFGKIMNDVEKDIRENYSNAFNLKTCSKECKTCTQKTACDLFFAIFYYRLSKELNDLESDNENYNFD
jgi:hypothetical protein